MRGARFRIVVTGLALAVLVAAPLAVGLSFARRAAPPQARAAIVATGRLAATTTFGDGSNRTELAWLLPGDRDPAVSPDGRRIAFSSARDGNWELYVVNAQTGAVQRLTVDQGSDDRGPTWSPDGRRIAWQSGAPGAFDLFTMGSDGRAKRLLVAGAGNDVEPAWSPLGDRIAFASNRNGHFDLWAVLPEGGEPELLLDARGAARAPAWSPDAARVVYDGSTTAGSDLWVVRLDGTEPQQLTTGPADDGQPDWSPDGRHVAFVRASAGRAALWIVNADGQAAHSLSGGEGGDGAPDWALAVPSLAPGPEQRLPDLDQRAPSGLVVIGSGARFLLGFTSAVENVGQGPLRIRGFRAAGASTMTAEQVIELAGGGTRVVPGVGRMKYEPHPPHYHWHFQPFERYELRRAADDMLVVRDRKSGFCLVDRYGLASRPLPGVGPPRFISSCGAGNRQLRRVAEGSSRGYVDRYPAFFHGQNVDITGLPTGLYVLVHRANPLRLVRELRYSNDDASVLVRLTRPAAPAAAPRVEVVRICEAGDRCPPHGR